MTETFTFHAYPEEIPPKTRGSHRRYLCKLRWKNGKIDYRTAEWLVGDSMAWFSLDGFIPTVDNKPTLCDIIGWAELPKP